MSTKKRILVVDDEREIIALLTEALEAADYEVASAADGEEALMTAATFKPHAVVLDVMMPKENGYRVSRMLKMGDGLDEGDVIPRVVLLTGRRLAEYPEREEMFQQFSMADAVLYKPVDLPAFLGHLAELIGQAPRVKGAAAAAV